MADKVSSNVRAVLWLLMTDSEFKQSSKSQGVPAAAAARGIKLDPADAKKVEQVDLTDLGDLLTVVERDLSMMMGGSRPRRAIALSDGAIQELQEALKIARSTEE